MTEEKTDSLVQISKEDYLSRLSEIDGNNLRRLGELFKKAIREKGRKGALIAVGGTLTKPLPRKDIDILVVFEKDPDKSQAANSSSYREALADFKFLSGIVETIVGENTSFQIGKVIEPAIDEEFGSESILKHDGSITIKPDNGIPIELIRRSKDGVFEVTTEIRRPYVVIAEVS